jgi:hypothetical protein
MALPFLESSTKPGVFPILRAVQEDFALGAVAKVAQNVGTAGSIWQMLENVLKTVMMELVMLPTPVAVTGNYETLESSGPPPPVSDKLVPVFLGNYMTKPQFFFGLPPTCNVFFPSQIQHYAYEENYITQPTRMYFNDEAVMSFLHIDSQVTRGLGAVMRDALAVAHPEEANLATRAAINHQGENGKNILIYPEEFFKGPVVDRRPIPTWFTFLAQAQQSTSNPNPDAPPDTELRREVAPGDTERNIYRKYASYEYHKEKYSRRSGGLQLAFNPYPVPGFPCAVFDRRSTQLDVFGYVMSIRQNMHSQGWSTQLSFSYGRTFKEMFTLLGDQIAADNANVAAQEATQAADATLQFTRLATPSQQEQQQRQEQIDNAIPIPVGPIVVAPAEPITEIRDTIQNFLRAEAFYRSLFFRAAAPPSDALTERQLRAEADRRAAASPSEVGLTTLALGAVRNIENPTQEANVPPLPGTATNQRLVNAELRNKRAAFFYYEIVDFLNLEGQREGIQLTGVDTTSRLRLLELLDQMRAGTASADDIQRVRDSVGRPTLQQQSTVEPTTAEERQIANEIATVLDSITRAVNRITTTTNIRGDVTVVPKAETAHLFESYEAAMRYGSRPICTLDEYVAFLGADGLREGLVQPQAALAQGDVRAFPAHYYMRIRRYRPGPPSELPTVNLTNADVSSLDGVSTQRESGQSPSSGEEQTEVQALPDDFPENRANWDAILIAYRNNVLTGIVPRT